MLVKECKTHGSISKCEKANAPSSIAGKVDITIDSLLEESEAFHRGKRNKSSRKPKNPN